MTDTCRITRAVPGTGVFNPVTGLYEPNPPDEVYVGVCRLRTGGTVSAGQQRQSAGDTVTQVVSILHLPMGAPTVRMNDRVEITSTLNPAVAGLVLTVSGLIPGSQMTAQRVQVTAVID